MNRVPAPAQPVRLADLRDMELFLPRPYNVVRKLVDAAFMRIGMAPRLAAEIESAFTLTAAIADGLAATIVPASMAREVVTSCGAWQFQIVDPVIEAPLALCQSDHLPLSEPAQAVKEILLGTTKGELGDLALGGGGQFIGFAALAPAGHHQSWTMNVVLSIDRAQIASR